MDLDRKRYFKEKVKRFKSDKKPKTSLFHIPEPQHRVTSVSKGMSFRKLPDPSFEEIRNTCLFYLKKAGGKVNPKSKTHRYLYDLTNEIIAITRHLEKFYDEKFRHQRKLIKRYKIITREWQDVFGSDFTDDEYVIGERFATPKTLYEELVRNKKLVKKLQHDLTICQDREKRTNLRYQSLISRHHDSSRQAMEKNYLCLNEKLERIMGKHKKEFLETVKEKNEFIQRLTNEVSKIEEERNELKKLIDTKEKELEEKDLEMIKQKKVILRQQQREFLHPHQRIANNGELSSIEPLMGTNTSLSMKEFEKDSPSALRRFLVTQNKSKDTSKEKEEEEESGGNMRNLEDYSEREMEMFSKKEVMNVLNGYRRKIKDLYRENENYLSILHRMQRAKFMDEFFKIKMRIKEMFGGKFLMTEKELDQVTPRKAKKKSSTMILRKNKGKKEKKSVNVVNVVHPRKQQQHEKSILEIDHERKWDGMMQQLDRNTLDTSHILERLKKNRSTEQIEI